jgi:branched-chain amino acid transport system permease protein
MDFNVNLFLQYTIIGLATGSLIALIALGYTLVYGIIELINFAHGEVFMMGAFFAATFIALTGATAESGGVAIFGILLLALIGSMLFSAGINFGIDRVGYQRLRNAPRLATLIAAIGFSFILQNIGIYWMGSNPFRPPEIIPLDIRSMNILTEWFGMDTSVRFRVLDLFVIGVTVPLLIGLSWFVYKTRVGTAMRATSTGRSGWPSCLAERWPGRPGWWRCTTTTMPASRWDSAMGCLPLRRRCWAGSAILQGPSWADS